MKHSPAGQQAQLGQAVRRDLAESERIIQVRQAVVTWIKHSYYKENEAVRNRLEKLYLDNPPVDWDSFLD